MPPKIIRDLSDTSGYWAAIWTLCPMPDVHVICDAPVGCFNLVGTAVPDYTDAIPHIENLTPATMTEQEVGGKGTSEKVRWTYENLKASGALDGKTLIVVSTAESEMIGSDHTKLVETFQPGTRFYYSNSLSEDEWAGRDRVLRWVWEQYGSGAARVQGSGVRGQGSGGRVRRGAASASRDRVWCGDDGARCAPAGQYYWANVWVFQCAFGFGGGAAVDCRGGRHGQPGVPV